MDTAALIRAYYAAFNRADFEGMLALLGDDIVHDANQGSRHAGKAWFRSFLAHMDRCYREQVVDLVVLTEASGSRAAAEFVIEGEYKVTDEGLPPANGQRYRLPVGAFFEVPDALAALNSLLKRYCISAAGIKARIWSEDMSSIPGTSTSLPSIMCFRPKKLLRMKSRNSFGSSTP